MRILKAGTAPMPVLAAAILAFSGGIANAGEVKRSATAAPASALKAPASSDTPGAESGSAAATAARIDKLLTPRASDPDVPLPMQDLSQPSSPAPAPSRAQVYGRAEQGGGVVGFRIPFSRGTGAVAPTTRYSSD